MPLMYVFSSHWQWAGWTHASIMANVNPSYQFVDHQNSLLPPINASPSKNSDSQESHRKLGSYKRGGHSSQLCSEGGCELQDVWRLAVYFISQVHSLGVSRWASALQTVVPNPAPESPGMPFKNTDIWVVLD